MRHLSIELKNFTLSQDERISLTHIDTQGNDLEDCLVNALVSFEDWHGNCICYGWTLDDLSQNDYDAVTRIISERLATSQPETKG